MKSDSRSGEKTRDGKKNGDAPRFSNAIERDGKSGCVPVFLAMRLDKWLWAARFFKTRTLAVEAIAGGRVSVNGERAKPAKEVRVGDAIAVRRPPFELFVAVKELSDKRGPAPVAATLYEETVESRAKRAAIAAEMKAAPAPRFKGRPTKKTRRDYEKWLRTGDDE
jgi:ribosome-associated heat shock protein Hsp15